MSIIEQFNLDGQVAVVTGAGRGIGEAIAVGLAEAGADVVVAARRTNEIERVAERIEALGRRALAVTCDVMDMAQVESLAQETEKAMGGLTCWVSNAGGADDRVARTLLEMPERQWDFQLNLNLKAVWSGAQAAARVDAARQQLDVERNAQIAEANTRIAAKRAAAEAEMESARTAVRDQIAAAVAQVTERTTQLAVGKTPDASFVEQAVQQVMGAK